MTSFRLDPSPDLSPRPAAVAPDGPEIESGTPLGRLCAWVIARRLRHVPVRITMPDGARAVTSTGPPVAALTIRDFAVLPGLVLYPNLTFGEAFETGRIEVAGDLVRFFEAVNAQQASARRPGRWREATFLHLRNSIGAARRNIHHHYDLGNDFYRLWLDPEMVYTCAYYPSPSDDLERAQVAKMDLVCRKLGLKAGERVVEAGCGWGALALFMARQYGVTVRAFNISTEQVRYARERAAREGLAGRVEFIDDDYRNMRGPYDVFVSIGMLEHVGLADYGQLGAVIHRGLPPESGRGLVHFIGRIHPAPLNPWINARIFPGAYPPTLSEVVRGVLEPWDFSVLDVENLRLHYARTLRHWLERFERSADRVTSMFDERFVRAWRLYLASSQAAFTAGSLQLFQVVFARGSDNRIPWIRGSRLPANLTPVGA
jgi:cyclopropane-fatty-acyl-phospholipid synthase